MFKWWATLKAMDAEQLAVLKDPALLGTVPAGWRRKLARKLAEMPAMERDDLYRFSMYWRGARLWMGLAKAELALFVIAGLLRISLLANRSAMEVLAGVHFVALCLGITLIGAWFNYYKIVNHKRKLMTYMGGLAALGAIYGAALAPLLGNGTWGRYLELLPKLAVLITLVLWVVFGVPVIIVALLRGRRYEVLSMQYQLAAERERMAREHSETQLRLLRAQIEPHFLFNTLGAVQQLAENGAPRAAELTAHLIDFLRASMHEMRSETASLDSEFAMVASYLRVMQVRMGARLSFSVELPGSLGQVAVPSMLVLTLAENAIKHGIEPSIGGGSIGVSASERGGAVVIRVHDTGVGLSDMPGQGMGLANVRDRLKLMFGERACLTLLEGEGGAGVLAEVVIERESEE